MTTTLQAAPATRQAGAPWTVPDAAAFLGIAHQTLERHIKNNKIASFKFGGRRLIADAVLRRIASGE